MQLSSLLPYMSLSFNSGSSLSFLNTICVPSSTPLHWDPCHSFPYGSLILTTIQPIPTCLTHFPGYLGILSILGTRVTFVLRICSLALPFSSNDTINSFSAEAVCQTLVSLQCLKCCRDLVLIKMMSLTIILYDNLENTV